MLQEQEVSVNFGQGVDTKTDSKLTVLGKLLDLKNAVFTKFKRISKRNGYTLHSSTIIGGGGLSSPKMVKAYRDELICNDVNYLYSFSSTLNRWVQKGFHTSVKVSNTPISRGVNTKSNPSVAKLGNYILYGYGEYNAAAGTSVAKITLVDSSTGVQLLSDADVGDSTTGFNQLVKAVALGSTSLAFTYISGSTADIVMRILTISTSSVSIGPVLSIGTEYTNGGGGDYDLINTSTGAAILYPAGATSTGVVTGLITRLIDTAGSAPTSDTTSTTVVGQPAIVRSSAGTLWIYWADLSTGGFVRYKIYNSTLSSTVLASTVISTSSTGIQTITAIELDATNQRAFYDVITPSTGSGSGSTPPYHVINTIQLTTAGSTGSTTPVIYGAYINTKPFELNQLRMLGIITAEEQNTSYIIDTGSSKIVASYQPGTSALSSIKNIAQISSSEIIIPVEASIANVFDPGAFQGTSSIYGIFGVSISSSDIDVNQCLIANDYAVFNGGVVRAYDSRYPFEIGYLMTPLIWDAPTPFGSGGSLPTGVYQYITVYEWYDANGNFNQSAPSIAQSVSVTLGQKVGIYYSNLTMTDKQNVQVAIYRTAAGTSTFRRLVNIANVPTSSYSYYDDTAASASGDLLYTDGGVVENSSAPASVLLALHNNRLLAVSSENPNVIWYSKTLGPGLPIQFSSFLVVNVNSKGGSITGLKPIDEKLVVFKRSNIMYLSGDGANDTGNGSTFSEAQEIPSDVGCTQSKSIVSGPGGVGFMSAKGIYILDRSINVSYKGAPVEDYNSQNITSALLLDSVSQIRFLTDSGSTLVYDYIMDQWSLFTNHAGYAADIWNGSYIYSKTDGKIMLESSSNLLDDTTAYAVSAKIAWIKFQSVQGFQRIKFIELLGNFVGTAGGHKVQITHAFDYVDSYSGTIQYTLPSSGSVFQFRDRTARQKCESMSLLIEEVNGSGSNEYIDFSDLTLTVGIKKGVNKLSQDASVN